MNKMDDTVLVFFIALVVMTMGFAYMYKNKPNTKTYETVINDLKTQLALWKSSISINEANLNSIKFKGVAIGDLDTSFSPTKQYNLAVTGACDDGGLHAFFVSNNNNKSNNPNGVMLHLINTTGNYNANRLSSIFSSNAGGASTVIESIQWGTGSGIQFATNKDNTTPASTKAIILPDGGIWLKQSVSLQEGDRETRGASKLSGGAVLYVNSSGNLVFRKPSTTGVGDSAVTTWTDHVVSLAN